MGNEKGNTALAIDEPIDKFGVPTDILDKPASTLQAGECFKTISCTKYLLNPSLPDEFRFD
ncbi:MAG TPA: hypothetical protein V6D12_00120 [Candidatus Obscuribacterales bacterium]